ncbi:hypothetical protein Pmani_005390 [Petrolisthes manimaculis]|uniref:Glucosylceramidase n=1 Tax=Petrolisthes manimaculis TaxID=1843537 RepID=A0AAE1UKK8_9EUCA|nr:hypothetical protein Pmani_005390 [Petrolisthes manimaculis]
MKSLVAVVLGVLWTGVAAQDCAPRQYGFDSVVCVCNATYCDNPGPISSPADATQFTSVISAREGQRFQVNTADKGTAPTDGGTIITLDRTQTRQSIIGFGGAFTDSTALNVYSLSAPVVDQFVKTYFSEDGIKYNLCRIPMAGSDCSTRPYSYDDVEGDVDLVNFALEPEDTDYKIPLILKAKAASPDPLLLFGSPWSPPAWMKSNGMFNGSGYLLPEMWQPYSNYFVKFVEAYEAAGADMWGLTTQNEPLSGFDENWGWNTCGWTAEDMRDWIKQNLGPTLEAAGMRRLKLMVDDFNRDTLPWYVQPMLEDPDCANYVDGTAVHWYSDQWVGPEVLDETQELFPDKWLLHTEACQGWDVGGEDSVQLGSWERAQDYVFRIIENLNHYTRGWVDWNMALDLLGGPNWANNMLDSPIIVNATADEFYKEPLFYTMGHLSKFVQPGYQYIQSSTTDGDLQTVAFQSADSSESVLIVLNSGESVKTVSVDDGSGSYVNLDLPVKSLVTLLYKL